jgi:RNA polymerase sigma-70 factor (ECF subfamily)
MRTFLSVVTVAALYAEHWSDLCGYLKRTFGSGPPEPEDVAQTTFARFAQLPQHQEIRNPKAFLLRMAHNIALSELRKARTHARYVADGVHKIAAEQGNDLTGERVLLEEEQLAIVHRALARMPLKRRRVLLLNRVHELSLAEIGRREHITGPAVGKHLRKALADLDDALREAEQGGERTGDD